VLKLGFTSDRLDPLALRDLVQWTVRPRLLAVPGVAEVSVYGGLTRRLEVRARPADLSDSDLGFLDVLNAVRRSTSVAGAGFIDTPSQRVLIEPHGQALTTDDVAAGQIQTPGSAPVRIGDVADVLETSAPAFGDAVIDGRPGVLLSISRQYGAGALDTTRAAEAALAVLAPSLEAQGVKLQRDLDRPASFTTRAIRGIALDLLMGAGLIALGLWVFLGGNRAVLIALASIPLATVSALVVLKLSGWSLNTMILGGLLLSVGMVIDDAVIGVETVINRLRVAAADHHDDLETTLEASLEVREPVTFAALAFVIVLAPLLVLPGLQGSLLAPLAVTVMTVAASSLFLATFVIPALCLLVHGHDGPPLEPSWLARFKDWHAETLARIIARPGPVLLAAAGLTAASLISFAFSRPDLLPRVSDGHVVAVADAPPSLALDALRAYGVDLAAAARRIDGVRAVTETIGRDVTGNDSWGPEHATFDFDLAPGLSPDRQRRIMAELQGLFASRPGLHTRLASRFDDRQSAAAATAPVEVAIYGTDLDQLDTAAERMASALSRLPGAGEVQVREEARGPVLRVDLNFARLALYSLSAADVLDTVQAAFAGQRVAQIYQNGRTIDVAVTAQDKLRQDPEAAGDLLLRSSSGISVPLKSVANVYLTDGRVAIRHDGGLRRRVVTANPTKPAAFISAARTAVAAPGLLPPATFAEIDGTLLTTRSAVSDLLLNFGLATLLVILMLRSALSTSSIVLTVISSLFSVVGAAVAVRLLGGVLSAGVYAGLIALLGLSLRTAILLFDRLEDLSLSSGQPPSAAEIIAASRHRVAPMLISLMLITLGLAPVALQTGAEGLDILGPMACVIICGLFTGTLGTLFVLPAVIRLAWRGRARTPVPHRH
jgi:Cu/Ag efflux pump CusA